MLRLAPPPGSGGPVPPRRRGPALSLRLTDDEARHLRASVRNVARLHFGSLAALARALDVNPNVLTRKRRPSPALAVAIARLTGISVETLLSGKLSAVPSPLRPLAVPPPDRA